MTHIRKSQLGDIKDLLILLDYLFEQEADFTPNAALQTEGLRQIISNEEVGIILVLEHDKKTIGMVNLLFTVSTALGGKVAILEDMIIHPSYRHLGYGSLLIRAATDEAKSQSCLRITLLTDADNTEAHLFYRKHGFSSSAMVPFRKLI